MEVVVIVLFQNYWSKKVKGTTRLPRFVDLNQYVCVCVCRLEIEAEPWMDGVLQTLLNILTPNLAASDIEENSSPTEPNLPCTQAAVAAEQPTNDQSLAEKLISSDVNSDFDASLRTVENLSDLVLTADLQSISLRNDDNVDVNSGSTETSDSHKNPSQPQCGLHLSSTGVLESSLVSNAADVKKEEIDAELVTEESLTHSLSPLSAMPLTVPLCPPQYLKLTFLPDEKLVCSFSQFHHYSQG